MKLMVSRIPKYNGFDAADAFMRSMLSHIEELSVDAIREIMRTYKNNSQCINRARNSSDLAEVKKYLETKTENEDNSEVSEE